MINISDPGALKSKLLESFLPCAEIHDLALKIGSIELAWFELLEYII